MAKEISVMLDYTPNPNSLKYSLNKTISTFVSLFTKKEQTDSDLINNLLAIPEVISVLISKNFITVTKSNTGEWEFIHDQCQKQIEDHFRQGNPLFKSNFVPKKEISPQSDIDKKICFILDNEIRPAVALDGGDITFDRFEDGIVYLELKGACSGCPSSGMTLKNGIEDRLKAEIPEIIEVVSV